MANICKQRTPMGFIKQEMDTIVKRYLPHPLNTQIRIDNAQQIAAHFLAISLGFPYAMAGSQRDLMDEFIERNAAPCPLVECTTAVANFLTWDEVGGHYAVLQSGVAGLLNILDTNTNFHGSMLKNDLTRIFNTTIHPEFSITGPYLRELCCQFAHSNNARRCAAFASFERHAEICISAFWQGINTLSPLDKRDFKYFDIHIGDDDPAEFYHVQATEGLVEKLGAHHPDEFLDAFETTFQRHVQWSNDVSQ